MKNKLKTLLALVLVFAMLLPGAALASDSEAVEYADESGVVSSSEEIIYGVLDGSGAPDSVYAVVILTADEAGETAYYGPFGKVANLTDTTVLKCEDGRMSGDIPEGLFYFQADLTDLSLPWFVEITYTLDGEEVTAQELGGATGALEIHIKTTQNTDVNSAFWDAYLMQVTVTLGTENCSNIVADGATIANSGSDKTVAFTLLPGTEGDLTVTADVKDFVMDGITIAAVPYTMADMLDNIGDLTSGLGQLTNAVSLLSQGASSLSDGAAALQSGAMSFGDGLAEISSNSDTLVNASSQILAALNQINSALSSLSNLTGEVDLSSLAFLPNALNSLASGLESASAQLGSLPETLNNALAAVNSALDSISYGVSAADIAELELANPGNAALQVLIANYYASVTLKTTLSDLVSNIQVSGTALTTAKAAIDSAASSARTLASQAQAAIDSATAGTGLGELSSLISGFSTLATEYASFHEGLVAYTGGVDALYSNWSELYGGMAAITAGTGELASGASQLDNSTSAIPSAVESLLADYTGVDFEPCSFLSERNQHVSAVQFVMTTAAIELPEQEAPAEEPVAEPGFFESLWLKIVDLFDGE